MRELWLLRHAKSAWKSEAPTDLERPLNKRGRADAPRLGTWMKARGLVPDAVYCSDAKRARQTAVRVLHELGIETEQIRYEHGLYLASCSDLMVFIRALPPTCERPLIIGHNPGLDDLIVFLCGPGVPRTKNGKLMTTAALARVGIGGDWPTLRSGGGTFRSLTRPRDVAPA